MSTPRVTRLRRRHVGATTSRLLARARGFDDACARGFDDFPRVRFVVRVRRLAKTTRRTVTPRAAVEECAKGSEFENNQTEEATGDTPRLTPRSVARARTCESLARTRGGVMCDRVRRARAKERASTTDADAQDDTRRGGASWTPTATTREGVPTRLRGAQAKGVSWCWATRANGSICGARADCENSCLPYCAEHLERGDEALRVVKHPVFGDKILIATRDLPKGYKTVYFGERKTWRECGRAGRDHAMHFRSGGGVIDPCPLGDAAQLQFMSNPGPNEVSNNRSTNVFFGDTRCPKRTLVGREFILSRDVKKGAQLLQWYGADWFNSRDIKRLDVGCDVYPAERKKRKQERADHPNREPSRAKVLGDATNASSRR